MESCSPNREKRTASAAEKCRRRAEVHCPVHSARRAVSACGAPGLTLPQVIPRASRGGRCLSEEWCLARPAPWSSHHGQKQ